MTKAARLHLSRVAALGCIVCRNLGHDDTPANAHHINCKTMGRKSSDFETIPLCHYHHQGPEGVHTLGTRAWERKYGTEQVLLAQTRAELGL